MFHNATRARVGGRSVRLGHSLIAVLLTLGGLAAGCSSHHNSPTDRTSPGSGAPLTMNTAPADGGRTPSLPATSRPTPHVMVIVEENHSYEQVIGNPALPFLNSLAANYGLATNYVGVSHPSEPNYLAMVSGSIWNDPQDLTPQDGTYPGPTLVDQMAAKDIGWKAYMEDMPSPCDVTDTYGPGGYDVNHNPFMYFARIRNSAGQCGRDVPFAQFAIDLNAGSAPPFIFVSPNTTHDMHDGTYQQGDEWLFRQFPVIFASNWYRQGGIVIVTFDEGETSDRIATVVVSASNHGAPRLATPTDHYGMLRGIEETYGLSLLGSAIDTTNDDLKPLLNP